MSVEAIQCPKCGGPLSVEEGRDSMYCSHCGSSLRITTGSSGHPMATLADIKDDTSLLAIRAALKRLEERLQERDNELRELETARAEAWEDCEAEQQQRQEQQQEKRGARALELRSQLGADAHVEKVLWALTVLCLALAMILIWDSVDSVARRGGFGCPVGIIMSLAAAGFLGRRAFSLRAKNRKTLNLLESAMQDEGAPYAESTNQEHKEALRPIDAGLDEIRSQIQAIESQRHTLLARLDSLTDQL